MTFSDLQQNNNESLFNKAINKAGCKEFISKLVLKDNTYVTRLFDSNGVELSGGENQRLALARTFFKNAQIILLNEPTSALDPEAEKELLNELKEYKENILIITSHKLTNVVIADKIILMHAGKIVEMGTKEELLNTDIEFNKLYSFQINTKEQFL
ncbi:ABC transporter ATP-binding protein [uncultured Eubacterium sp.]|uniref:ABC transporter ATP-binding protein n=1 Tax=uncultured Eubacterium sp. TaxID=165185 RepID=UPI00344E9DA0